MNHDAPSVRDVDVRELGEAAALVAGDALFARYGATAESLEAAWRAGLESGDRILAAVASGAVVGVAWLVPHGAFARSPYLRLLAVGQGVAGRGVGSALLLACEDLAFAAADDLFLLVSETNDAARRFYERRSFVEIGRVHDYVRPGLHDIVMRKRRPSPTDRGRAATCTSQRPPPASPPSHPGGSRLDP